MDLRGSYSCQPLTYPFDRFATLENLYPTGKIFICGSKDFVKFFQQIYKEAT